jgi:hypothetical protein
VQAVIRDISRGGLGILHDGQYQIGTDMTIELPGGSSVHGRIVRTEPGLVSLAFRQDAATLVHIDRALAIIGQGNQRAAA